MTGFLPVLKKKNKAKMSSYNHFASVYDELTENVEYKKRFEYMMSFFNDFSISAPSKVLDLACGTGNFSVLFSNAGYNVTGIDASTEMLTVAETKCSGKVDLRRGDMRSFELGEKYDACICCLDSLNHLPSIDDVQSTFDCVHDSLKTGGLFIFDVNTIYKHNKILSDQTFVFDCENYFLSWDNEYISDGEVEIFLDLFTKEKDGRYSRYSENFKEKAYTSEALKKLLKLHFDIVGIFDDMTRNEPNNASERLYFVCRSK